MAANLLADLTAERRRRNITVAALARRLGYAPCTIRNWENGFRTPTTQCLTEYAAALGYQITLTPNPSKGTE